MTTDMSAEKASDVFFERYVKVAEAQIVDKLITEALPEAQKRLGARVVEAVAQRFMSELNTGYRHGDIVRQTVENGIRAETERLLATDEYRRVVQAAVEQRIRRAIEDAAGKLNIRIEVVRALL